jgi:hypothetical protein
VRKVGSIELVNDFSLNDPCTRRVSECLIDYVPDLELGILIDMKNRAVKVPESFSGNPLIIRGDPQVAAKVRLSREASPGGDRNQNWRQFTYPPPGYQLRRGQADDRLSPMPPCLTTKLWH